MMHLLEELYADLLSPAIEYSEDLLYSQVLPVALRGSSPNAHYSQSNVYSSVLKFCHILEAPEQFLEIPTSRPHCIPIMSWTFGVDLNFHGNSKFF